MTKDDFLNQHGVALVQQGFRPIPIKYKDKMPAVDGWSAAKGTPDEVNAWLDSGHRNCGVGIVTGMVCAIDIDCRDKLASDFFKNWCFDNIGTAPVRVGLAPKQLLLYRTAEPLSKRSSNAYRDEWGEKHQIEILGKGQQFVAYGIHKDTGKPYEWVDGVSPLNVRAADLILMTAEHIETVIAEFEVYAHKNDWTLDSKGVAARKQAQDTDNPWVEDSTPVELSDDELRKRLMMVPGADHHDTWVRVGMALYHQYDGEQTGLDLWREWSETADNYDQRALDKRWKSFAIEGKKRAPLTARLILRLSKDAVAKTTAELSVTLADNFINAKDLQGWEEASAAVAKAEISAVARSLLWSVAKDRLQRIEQKPTHLSVIKKALAYVPKKSANLPGWVEKWVYDTSDDRFVHTDDKYTCTKQGFDAANDRYAFTMKDLMDGNQNASQSASEIALNVHTIPVVIGRRYMPGNESVYRDDDGLFVNTYREPKVEAPNLPLNPKDARNVKIVHGHFAHLLEREDEQRMFLDWLSFVVQNPGSHANYAVLLQGTEGDGKSFFTSLMMAVMGRSNVGVVNGHTLVVSQFSDWAAGQCLMCVEEVRMVAGRDTPDKWEAINKIKPFVTNDFIEIHPKGKPAYGTKNTTNYLMFSNHKDALPLDENTRRYLILFSRWQTGSGMREFNEKNPNYYKNLFGAVQESPEALRHWLLNHKQHESFNPSTIAPSTTALRDMVYRSKPWFIQELLGMIRSNIDLEASEHLVDITGLRHVMDWMSGEWPKAKSMSAMLEREGYSPLGEVRLGPGRVHTFYSKTPEMFMSGDEKGVLKTDIEKIRQFLKLRAAELIREREALEL